MPFGKLEETVGCIFTKFCANRGMWSLLRILEPRGCAILGALGHLLEPLEDLGASGMRNSGGFATLGDVQFWGMRNFGGLGADPKDHQDDMLKKVNFQTPRRRIHHPYGGGFGEAKIDQKPPQDTSKFKTIFKSEKVALQEPLGAVLGRSWGAGTSKIVLSPSVALIF